MESTIEQLWQRLRRMKDPFTGNGLVALDCVRDIRLAQGAATVVLAPISQDPYRNEALEDAIRRELRGVAGVDCVVVTSVPLAGDRPRDAEPSSRARRLPVLDYSADGQAEAGEFFGERADLAPEAGYGPEGLPALESPEFDAAAGERYAGWPPVFQWEIDPREPTLSSGEAHVELGEWEYDIWWQVHPTGLIYASIQAMRDDTLATGPQRQHPLGRNVAVNLVYDRRREGVVAVYGTARDFRPFIEVFRIGLGLQSPEKGTDAHKDRGVSPAAGSDGAQR